MKYEYEIPLGCTYIIKKMNCFWHTLFNYYNCFAYNVSIYSVYYTVTILYK